MTYRVLSDDTLVLDRDRLEYDGVAPGSERFATENEALRRARELLDENERKSVAVCDGDGNVLGGVRLQLKLGHHGD